MKTSFENINTLRETEGVNAASQKERLWSNLKYAVIGTYFGILFVKSEIISWFRIQEMFRLQSFHLYSILGMTAGVAATSIWLLKKFKVKTLQGDVIEFAEKPMHKGVVIGGLLFGCGWAMTGGCPGLLYAQIGAGFPVIIVNPLFTEGVF